MLRMSNDSGMVGINAAIKLRDVGFNFVVYLASSSSSARGNLSAAGRRTGAVKLQLSPRQSRYTLT